MTELQLGFGFMPAATQEESMIRAAGRIPPDEPGRIAYARDLLRRYHEAMLGSEIATAGDLAEEIKCVGLAMNGGTNFGAAMEEGGFTRLSRALRAPDGEIPMVGQAGRFVTMAAGCRVVVHVKDMVGLFLGGFDTWAVDWGQPFISDTGYHSFCGVRPVAGMNVSTWAIATIEASRWLNTDGKRQKATKPLVPVMYYAPPDYLGEKDPAWREGGWLYALWREAAPRARKEENKATTP